MQISKKETLPKLPYDGTCPVIYDNDGAIESGYTDIYIMALASAGVIDLKGIITSCSYGEWQRTPPFSPIPEAGLIGERQELIEKARRSGMRNLPDVIAGPSLSHKRPASDRIEDTIPFNTPGTQLILREARKATPQKPLVILMGGQATCVVDAYLIDPSIADKVVLAWQACRKREDGSIDSLTYNAGIDPWSHYIATQRLRVVFFSMWREVERDPVAHTPRSRMIELPDTELRQVLTEALFPREAYTFSEPEYDFDVICAFPLTRSDYIKELKRFSFNHWEPCPEWWESNNLIPFHSPDPNGRLLVAWESSADVATEEWWRRVKDPAAWAGEVQEQVPYLGKPWTLPGTIPCWQFDHGGNGRAYGGLTFKFSLEQDEATLQEMWGSIWKNPIRILEHIRLAAAECSDNTYKVTQAKAGNWMEYTVKVAEARNYTIAVRVASNGPGGSFHLEFDGENKTGSMNIPDTNGAWQTVSGANVTLKEGVHIIRLVMETNGANGIVGDFDCMTVTAAS